MYDRLGGILEALCRSGGREAVLVSPFIKRAILSRLLTELPVPVRLLCVTRWRPEEVAAGVSDPDIWLDVRERKGASLHLCFSLHAKYYRVDETCFVGSANLTAAALGWSNAPNLEILCPFGGGETEREEFEHRLAALSVPCSDTIYQEMMTTASLLKKEPAVYSLLDGAALPVDTALGGSEHGPAAGTALADPSTWLPQSREPADLYLTYSGHTEGLDPVCRATAIADLAQLQMPPGLTEYIFRRYVATQLLQVPCIASVDTFVTHSQRFGAVRAYLSSLPCSRSHHFDATRAWQNLMRWLLYFLPERYEHSVPNHSEVFRVRR